MRPIRVVEPHCVLMPSRVRVSASSRFVTQTLPSLSTVVRDGSSERFWGAVRYSPRMTPVSTSIRTAVPRAEFAM